MNDTGSLILSMSAIRIFVYNIFVLFLENLKSKLAELQDDLESTQKLMEAETLQRVDFENKLQSVKEELIFKERVYKEVSTFVFFFSQRLASIFSTFSMRSL